jgi:flagellar capping protein FliD
MTEPTSNTTEAKVFLLCMELDDIKKRKKDFVKAYNEEIKRINAEIKDLLNPEEKVELP